VSRVFPWALCALCAQCIDDEFDFDFDISKEEGISHKEQSAADSGGERGLHRLRMRDNNWRCTFVLMVIGSALFLLVSQPPRSAT
jgi:hypothetical protein